MTQQRTASIPARTWWFGFLVACLCLPGVVRANYTLINYGPTPFVYYPPKDVEGVPGHVQKIFSWSASSDPEGGVIIYKLRIYQDGNLLFMKDDIKETFCAVDMTAEIPDYDPQKDFTFEILAEDPFWQEERPTLAVNPNRNTALTGVSSVTVPAYVWGYIYDAESGQPITDALIYTANASTASEDGTYGLRVQAGTLTIIVSASGYEPVTFDLELEEGEVYLQNISLQRTFFTYRATLWGAIRDESTSNLVQNARLYYGDEEIHIEGGSYILNLPEGHYQLRCIAPGYEEGLVEITLRRNATVQGDFALEATDEHVWACRQSYDVNQPDIPADPRLLDVSFSGMSGEYDIYVAAQVQAGPIVCLLDGVANWSAPNEVVPLIRSATIPDGSYSVLLMNVLVNVPEAVVLVVCTRPGANVGQVSNWEAWAVIDWK